MSFKMPKCKITILKRTINQDLIDEYLDDEYKGISRCDCFRDNQQIVIEDYLVVPDGFCASAWADIRKDLLTVAMGANIPGFRHPGTVITGCTDWFRPMIFKVERIADD